MTKGIDLLSIVVFASIVFALTVFSGFLLHNSESLSPKALAVGSSVEITDIDVFFSQVIGLVNENQEITSFKVVLKTSPKSAILDTSLSQVEVVLHNISDIYSYEARVSQLSDFMIENPFLHDLKESSHFYVLNDGNLLIHPNEIVLFVPSPRGVTQGENIRFKLLLNGENLVQVFNVVPTVIGDEVVLYP